MLQRVFQWLADLMDLARGAAVRCSHCRRITHNFFVCWGEYENFEHRTYECLECCNEKEE